MTRIICSFTLLAGVCFFGLAPPALSQTTTGADPSGIPGILDPNTGSFKPLQRAGSPIEEILAASTTVTGKLVFNFTITVSSLGLTGDTVVCTATASLFDSPTTGGIFITESASVGAKEASTVTCTVTIPYSWTLATMSTDKVSLSYAISVAGSTATTVLPNRVSAHGLGSISVPANSTTTTQTIKATI
jgi:hypothetical protein